MATLVSCGVEETNSSFDIEYLPCPPAGRRGGKAERQPEYTGVAGPALSAETFKAVSMQKTHDGVRGEVPALNRRNLPITVWKIFAPWHNRVCGHSASCGAVARPVMLSLNLSRRSFYGRLPTFIVGAKR